VRPPTSLSRLDGSINEPLSSAHGVEVELCRSQSSQVRVLDKSPRLGAVVVLDEVGQGAVAETKRDPFSLNVLLADTCDDLRTRYHVSDPFVRSRCTNSSSYYKMCGITHIITTTFTGSY